MGGGAIQKESGRRGEEVPERDAGGVEEGGVCSEMVVAAAGGDSPILPFPLLSSPVRTVGLEADELSRLPCLSGTKGNKGRLIALPRYAVNSTKGEKYYLACLLAVPSCQGTKEEDQRSSCSRKKRAGLV